MKAKIKSTDEDVQLSIIHSIYKTVRIKTFDQDGNPIIGEKEKLVKQIPVKRWIKKDAIVMIEEYMTYKNSIAKNRCIVYDRFSNRFYAAFHNPEELWNIINKKNPSLSENPIGFKKR